MILFLSLVILGCDRLNISVKGEKVFLEEELFVFERVELEELANSLPIPLEVDRTIYDVIKERYREVEELAYIFNEEKLMDFLLKDSIDVEINREINVEIEGTLYISVAFSIGTKF